MKPVDLLPYLEWEPASGGTERLYADAVPSEDMQAPALVTEHAVETGATISDHYLPQPIKVKLELRFSDSPIRGDLDPEARGVVRMQPLNLPDYPRLAPLISPRGLVGAAVTGVTDLLGMGPSMPKSYEAMSFPDSPPNRLRRALEKILALRAERTLVVAGTSTARVENLAIENVGLARRAEDGDGGTIVLQLGQIEFATTDVAAAVPLPLEPRGQQKKNSNAGGTTPVPAGPKQSAAAAVADSVF